MARAAGAETLLSARSLSHSGVGSARHFMGGALFPPQARSAAWTCRRSSTLAQVRAFMDQPKGGPVGAFFRQLQGNLPIVGLLSRLGTSEGGVGADLLRFGDFVSRVQRNLPPEAAKALATFNARHGKAARAQVVLLLCYVAAVGAGLVKSEQLLMSARRLRVSHDLEYELNGFDSLLDEAHRRRMKAGAKPVEIPMEVRADKALEAICACCIGSPHVAAQDADLLISILSGVFPTAEQQRIVESVHNRVQSRSET